MWYESLHGLPDGYKWRDGTQWASSSQLLPSGDIIQYGIGWKEDTNSDIGGMDNFRVYI